MVQILNKHCSGKNTNTAYSTQDDMLKMSSIQKRMRDDFLLAGGLDTSKWSSVVGTGMGLTATAGLVITTGTTINAETYILSKDVYTLPVRIAVGVKLSQRIANQTFLVELVSVDPVTLVPDNNNIAAWVFDGTTVTHAKYRVTNSGASVVDSSAVTVPTTAGGSYYEVEPTTDECWFHSSLTDQSVTRQATFRKNLRIPDPNALYKIRIRAVNGGTAPASSTTLTVPFISVDDYSEVTAEITSGRGQASVAQAMGVQVLNTPSVSFSANQVVAQSPNTTAGGYTTASKLFSAASTNATSVKASAANVGFLSAYNTSATIRYLKIYNKASAPAVGTDVPVHTFVLPATSFTQIDLPAAGLRLTTGFALAITGGLADADTTAIVANDVILNYEYV